jgi:hypothetical protein
MEYLHTDTYPATKEEFEKQVTFKGDFQVKAAYTSRLRPHTLVG